MLGTGIASAKLKRLQRSQLLEQAGLESQPLKSIDALDAALCALMAGYLLLGQVRAYGDVESGYIFTPELT